MNGTQDSALHDPDWNYPLEGETITRVPLRRHDEDQEIELLEILQEAQDAWQTAWNLCRAGELQGFEVRRELAKIGAALGMGVE